MNFSHLPTCPIAFKSINPYLQRAKEMEKVDPVISYWCTFHAAQTCMSIGHNEAESREFLMRLLDLLEHAKTQLSDNDAITNNLAATAYVENFALKVFDGADKEDQQGLATKVTAQRFLAAACFLEVLQSLTNQPESDIIQKIKYAKYRAGFIAKLIREGTGLQENLENLNQQQQQQQREKQVSPGSISSSEAIGKSLTRENNQINSESNSSIKKKIEEDDWPKELGNNSIINKLPTPPLTNNNNLNPFSNQNNNLNLNKLSPFPSTVFPPTNQNNNFTNDLSKSRNSSLDSNHLSIFPIPPNHQSMNNNNNLNFENQSPVQKTFYSTPSTNINNTTQNQKNTILSNLNIPISSSLDIINSTNTTNPSDSTTNPSDSTPTTTTMIPSNSNSINCFNLSNNNHLSSSSSSTTTTTTTSLDPIKISNAQKHAKWAISALNFDDILTAKNQLQISLDLLNSI